MAKNDARKSFVAARLKETGKEATPEQRAKFRERFNQLSQTKEGRTTIAQKVLPGGTAAERKALKGSIRPPQTSTSTTSTTATTSNKTDYPGFVNKGYGKGILNNVNLPSNNFSSSAPIPSTTTTVPKNTKTPIIVPGSNSGTRPDFSNPVLNFLFGGLPGTDSWKAKPGFSAADLPLGTGQIYTGIQETKKGNYVGGIARTLAGVGELAINILSTKGGRSRQLQIGPGQQSGPTRYGSQTATPLQLGSGPKTTVTQVSPSPSVAQTNAAARMAALENASAVPVNPPRSTVSKPRVAKPTVAKPVEVKSATPSPPVTTPMKYDAEGFRLNQVGERVTDPTSDAGLKGWRPGDAKPKAPPVGRTKGKTTTEWLDYEYRLDAYNKYNPKKK